MLPRTSRRTSGSPLSPNCDPERLSASEPGAVAGPVSLARSTAAMTVGTVISRVTGVVRLAVLAATLGVTETRLTDSYNLANMAPNILYELVLGGVITAVFVPVFVELLRKDDHQHAWQDISGVVTWSLLALSILAVIGVLAAPWIAGFYASRLEGAAQADQQRVIEFLLRLFIPQVVLYGIYFMSSALLNARGRLVLPSYTLIVNNLVLIVVLIVFQRSFGTPDIATATTPQLLLLGLGTTLSVAPGGLLLLPYVFKLGSFRPSLRIDPALWRKLLRLSTFIGGTVAANQIGYLVVQWLSNGTQGGYTAYISAFTFFLLPIGLFVVSLTTAMAPSLSHHALSNDWDLFKDDLSRGVRAILFVMMPATAGFLIVAHPLVEAFLEHGVVTGTSTALIVDVLTFFVLGLVQFSLFQVLVRGFYSMQNGRTPFLINCVVIALNIAVNVPMYRWLGIPGLAAGHALAYTVGVVLLTRSLSGVVGAFDLRKVGLSFAKIALATAGMAALAWGTLQVFDAAVGSDGTARYLAGLVAATVVGAVAYLGLSNLLKIEEFQLVRRALLKRG